MADNQEKRKRHVAPNLRQEIWDWLDNEAAMQPWGGSQNAHLSDLITTLYDYQMSEKSPDWEDVVLKEGGVYG